ncbi:MAG: HD domain-containing protein [Melioribacteraceae bacterium]
MKFTKEAAIEGNEKYIESISREQNLYKRSDEIRSEFYRDYTRILHSTAYRRLKHKTQVFFATHNDHVCTRIEHVNHVASISYTISKDLGLNTELTSAIAIGHDVGHAPFGHQGETILKEIVCKDNIDTFWHERNSLFFIDNIETLPDVNGDEQNLSLTYAVRDGIVCHCGEVDETSIRPRNDVVDLKMIFMPNQYSPFTWEGCVVKISDKIAYLGRDIEDARLLNFLDDADTFELLQAFQDSLKRKIEIKDINNTTLIHLFVIDLCKNSSPEEGLKLSIDNLKLMKFIKDFNYKKIYNNDKLNSFKNYTKLIINLIYNNLLVEYDSIKKGNYELKSIRSSLLKNSFKEWLDKYSIHMNPKYKNKIQFNLDNEKDYKRCIVYYISGMTDSFAISIFNELNSF